FKKEKRAENIVIGRSDVERELQRCGKNATEAQKLEIITNVAHRIGIQEPDDLYNAVGYGGLAISQISAKIKDEYDRIVKSHEEEKSLSEEERIVTKTPKNIRSNSGIILDGESGYAIKFAKCCNPLPGDNVIGFVTKGYGVSIHKRDCPNVISGMKKEESFQRWIPASWDPSVVSSKNGLYEAILKIVYENQIGVLAEISSALADMKVSIMQINTRPIFDERMSMNMGIGCKNIDHYDSIVSRIKNIKGVISVTRGFN
ncbi:MAG: bifunctional (p)ppGpp synthetase/guanosine-3',5'-bis(diphosphate) 3'-pyrophosphohydrolase, partial [Clostridia bacterium]|nr:bifunctional (p)ppGpp synthetase/guanosine-3',5'-bis(diphosphate) 3'-pyrophosphohydrolase [Clostridia bacterium]